LSAASSWIVLGGGVGTCWLLVRGRSAMVRLCCLAFFFQVILVSAYYIIEQRYALDLFPFLVFVYAAFLTDAAARPPLRGRALDLVTILIFSVGISSVVTVSSTLSAIPVSGPALSSQYKAEWSQRFQWVDDRMPAGRGG